MIPFDALTSSGVGRGGVLGDRPWDGLMEGIKAGRSMMDFVPLRISEVDRSTELLLWIRPR